MIAAMDLENITIHFTDNLENRENCNEISFSNLPQDQKYNVLIEISGTKFDLAGVGKEILGKRLSTILEREENYKVYVEQYYRGTD